MLKSCHRAWFFGIFLPENLEVVGERCNFALAFGDGGSRGSPRVVPVADSRGLPEKKLGEKFGGYENNA